MNKNPKVDLCTTVVHWLQCVCVWVCMCVSCLVVSDSLQTLFAAYQASLSMGFSRQEHWSGLPFPSPKETIERKKVKSFSRVRLFATPSTEAHQAPPSTEFSRQEYWSGLPFPSLLLTIDEPILAHHYHPKSMVHIRVHS